RTGRPRGYQPGVRGGPGTRQNDHRRQYAGAESLRVGSTRAVHRRPAAGSEGRGKARRRGDYQLAVRLHRQADGQRPTATDDVRYNDGAGRIDALCVIWLTCQGLDRGGWAVARLLAQVPASAMNLGLFLLGVGNLQVDVGIEGHWTDPVRSLLLLLPSSDHRQRVVNLNEFIRLPEPAPSPQPGDKLVSKPFPGSSPLLGSSDRPSCHRPARRCPACPQRRCRRSTSQPYGG